jgi:hypothetical protein
MGIVYQRLYRILSIIQHRIVQRRIPLLTLQINIIWIPQHLKNILHIGRHPLLTRQHQRCHLFPIGISQICTILY